MNLKFIDLDKEIEKSEGISIRQIFEEKKEEYFREIESTLLKKITRSEDRFVMATGGGAPCFFDNMDFMKLHGITIYIKASVEDLLKQLSDRGIEKRPLLNQIGKDQLGHGLTEKLAARREFYEKAAIIQPFTINMSETILTELRRIS
jgi:shikimate kinase